MYSIIITDGIVQMFKMFRCEGRGLPPTSAADVRWFSVLPPFQTFHLSLKAFLHFYKPLENYGAFNLHLRRDPESRGPA